MRIVHLISLALFACALNSGLGWLAIQNQSLFVVVRNGYCIGILFWLGAWFLDDKVSEYLKLETSTLWGILAGIGAVVVIGLGVVALW